MTDTSRRTTLLRGLVGTAVEMKYPMWLVPVSAFVKLTKLEPHQVMRHRGELVRWEPSMQTVFFLSHQWTSFEHPDHTMDQVRCFKRLLIRMMKGEVATTVPDFAAQSTTIPIPIKPRARVHRPPPRREWLLQSFTPAIANPLSPPATHNHKQTTNVLLVTCTVEV